MDRAALPRSTRSRPANARHALLAGLLVLAVTGLAGCGTKSKEVAAKAATTVAATSTTAGSDTSSSDTSSTDTSSTDTSSSDTSSTDTGSSDTSTSSGSWPSSLAKQVQSSCETGLSAAGDSSILGQNSPADVCACVLRGLESQMSLDDVLSVGADAQKRARLTELTKNDTLKCVANTSAF